MDDRSDMPQRTVAVLVLAANLLALSACSSSNNSITPTATHESATNAACVQTSKGTYCKVDDTSACTGICQYEVTGINDSRDIVGNYSNCTTGTGGSCTSTDWSCGGTGACNPCPLVGGEAKWHSYMSVYGNASSPYSTFFDDQYPDAPQGQYMYAISNEKSDPPKGLSSAPTPPPTIEVGCINKFGGTSGNLHGVWPHEDNNGLWSEHEKEGDSHNCGKPDGNVGGLVGMDIANLQTVAAVGFYDNYKQSCDFRLWKIVAGGGNNGINVSFATTSFTAIHIIGTGIAGTQGGASQCGSSCYIVGTATGLGTGNTPVQLGWLRQNAYCYGGNCPVQTYQCPNKSPTAFAGAALVNGHLNIVGWCKEGTTTHGLVAVYVGSTITAQTIDEPKAQGGLTVINGINDKGDICGWYTDGSGNYHGFVGLGIASALRKHHRHHLATKHIASVSHHTYEM